MDRFHIIEEGAVITRARGVFKQAKLYQRAGDLYVGAAGGYVRLYGGGNTGVPSLSWDDIEVPNTASADLKTDVHGKLSLPAPIKTIEAK